MFIDKEEMMLRELAAGRCVIPKVTEVLGPMSLWSKAGFDAEIRKAVEAEREACAQICEERAKDFHALFRKYKHEEDAGANIGATQCMDLIRARGEA